jgi:hypothetical protein
MKCAECLALLARLPDTDPASLPAAVREHVAECPACASRQAALRLLEEGVVLRVQPPAGLAESIVTRLAAAPVGRGQRRSVLRWAPLAAAALLTIAVTAPLVHRAAGTGGKGVPAAVVRVHLTLDAPSALEVDVVGDWNDWNPKAQPMRRKNGRWEIVLELQRGRCYQYQFLIDGDTWVPDPKSLAKVDNGFGGVNSLLGS